MPADSVASEQVINKLKELGYRFDHETEHTRVFKKRGGGKLSRVLVPRRQMLEVRTALSILRQAGASQDEGISFVKACTG